MAVSSSLLGEMKASCARMPKPRVALAADTGSNQIVRCWAAGVPHAACSQPARWAPVSKDWESAAAGLCRPDS